ncbi:anti-anti-sigma factor [Bacillus ectoiniformans]|uniref:STAS domain-containing protein n=1 Tax=Bacillus ectoiniformans TaxID=1494429 RepID=UPI00195C0322|nr:STAS domain-containing protein [Bacillus ectoiniformans]MBM7647903.1 anti-anti-sigma factor [Bacillus ectoiniformans]
MISQIQTDQAIVITFHTDLNFETCRSLEKTIKDLSKAIESAQRVVLNLSEVEFIDSTGISLLIKWLYPYKDKNLSAEGVSENIVTLFEICKMDQFLKIA